MSLTPLSNMQGSKCCSYFCCCLCPLWANLSRHIQYEALHIYIVLSCKSSVIILDIFVWFSEVINSEGNVAEENLVIDFLSQQYSGFDTLTILNLLISALIKVSGYCAGSVICIPYSSTIHRVLSASRRSVSIEPKPHNLASFDQKEKQT